MKHEFDAIEGIPVLRFCDRLDGFVLGVKAMAQVAKDLRMQEAIEAKGSESPPQQKPQQKVESQEE